MNRSGSLLAVLLVVALLFSAGCAGGKRAVIDPEYQESNEFKPESSIPLKLIDEIDLSPYGVKSVKHFEMKEGLVYLYDDITQSVYTIDLDKQELVQEIQIPVSDSIDDMDVDEGNRVLLLEPQKIYIVSNKVKSYNVFEYLYGLTSHDEKIYCIGQSLARRYNKDELVIYDYNMKMIDKMILPSHNWTTGVETIGSEIDFFNGQIVILQKTLNIMIAIDNDNNSIVRTFVDSTSLNARREHNYHARIELYKRRAAGVGGGMNMAKLDMTSHCLTICDSLMTAVIPNVESDYYIVVIDKMDRVFLKMSGDRCHWIWVQRKGDAYVVYMRGFSDDGYIVSVYG